MIVGDFNVILSKEKNIDVPLVYHQEYKDFEFCLNFCEPFDINYKESPFFCWNGKVVDDCIFKRIDRVLMN